MRLLITLLRSADPFGEPLRWSYDERPEDLTAPCRAVGVTDGGYLVRIPGHADFFIEKGGAAARVFVQPPASARVVEPLFLEQALPLWLSLLGRPCLHASAVAWGEGDGARAIAFAGRSGSGKSTLVTSLATGDGSRSGVGGLLADDCFAVEIAGDRVLAHPGHQAVRLLGDSAEALLASATAGEPALNGGKRRVQVPAAERALPLARIYALEPAAGRPRASPLRPRDALACLAASFFRIDPEDRSRLAAELPLLEQLAARTRVVRLEVPRRFDALAEVRAVIEADLAGG